MDHTRLKAIRNSGRRKRTTAWRLNELYSRLRHNGLDGLIVSLPANISYLTGARSRDSYALICRKKNVYFTDSRYIQEAAGFLGSSFALKKSDGTVFRAIAESCLELGLKKVGFEERYLPYAEYKKMRQFLGRAAALSGVSGLIEELRQLKSPQEAGLIRQSVRITARAIKYIKTRVKAGMKEVEVAAELERYIRYNGAVSSAFEIIVASGFNSAFPHHLPTERRIRRNEPVLIDIGADFKGYKSDLTRVFFLGKINALVRKVYDIVRGAQEAAIMATAPGVPLSRIDGAARSYIAQRGFGPNFSHNLGHGIGLEVHELPQVCPKDTAKAEPGMVFTLEPAVYLPGKFGIRIEDVVMITEKGCEVISGALDK